MTTITNALGWEIVRNTAQIAPTNTDGHGFYKKAMTGVYPAVWPDGFFAGRFL